MKKSISTIGAILFLSVLLAACNTDTAEPIVTGANEQQPNNNEQVPNEPEQTNEDQQEDSTSTPTNTTDETDESKSEPIEKNEASTLTYMSNGQPVTEEVVSTKSEEMDYTIQHFENYVLVAEEPGVDHLFYNEDDALSMQIEVVKKEETTFDQIKTTANETMSAISAENLKELDLSAISTNREEISNIIGYETMLDGEKVVKVVFERENLFAVLTIYDNPEKDLTDAFLQMGLTIQ